MFLKSLITVVMTVLAAGLGLFLMGTCFIVGVLIRAAKQVAVRIGLAWAFIFITAIQLIRFLCKVVAALLAGVFCAGIYVACVFSFNWIIGGLT